MPDLVADPLSISFALALALAQDTVTKMGEPLRLLKRPVYGMRFDYKFDFDQNGIIYWISTKGKGWDSHYINPHVSGEVKVVIEC